MYQIFLFHRFLWFDKQNNEYYNQTSLFKFVFFSDLVVLVAFLEMIQTLWDLSGRYLKENVLTMLWKPF